MRKHSFLTFYRIRPTRVEKAIGLFGGFTCDVQSRGTTRHEVGPFMLCISTRCTDDRTGVSFVPRGAKCFFQIVAFLRLKLVNISTVGDVGFQPCL